jgi:hypothetical protein
MPLSNALSLAIDKDYLAADYINKILSFSPMAYWPLNETSGVDADNAEGTAARDGTYSGVTLDNSTGPDEQPVGLWDGANDTCDIQTASLASAFNGPAGTIAVWCKVINAGFWTDANNRAAFRVLADANNYVIIYSPVGHNTITMVYNAGATTKQVIRSSYSPTSWFHLAMTWDAAAGATGEMKAFFDGAQYGSTQTLLGTWANSLTESNIGSNATPASVWSGWLAHAAVWDSALTPAQIASLATV